MKKIIGILIVLTSCFLLTGCDSYSSLWSINVEGERAEMEQEELEIFYSAAEEKCDVVALLAKQVVSGTNYMYLCRHAGYKVIVIYNDLEGNSSLISDISHGTVNVVGGWLVQVPTRKTKFEEELQKKIDEANGKVTDIKYYPAAVLAEKNNEIALLSYGVANPPDDNIGVYVLTLNTKKNKITSSAYVDLSNYYE